MIWPQLSYLRDYALLIRVFDERFTIRTELLAVGQVSAGFLSVDPSLFDRASTELLSILFVLR